MAWGRSTVIYAAVTASALLAACVDDPIKVDCGQRTLQDFAHDIPETPRAAASPVAHARLRPDRPTYDELLLRAAAAHASLAPPAAERAPGAVQVDFGPTYVLLSGGGQWGAFGAGFLEGWSENGRGEYARPALPDAVTGVSTGAIQASAVYLGPSEDGFLETEYKPPSQSVLVKDRGGLFFLTAGSRADQRPLYSKLVKDFDPIIDKVVAEHEIHPKRLLLVGVVNAQTGGSQAIDLIEIATTFSAPEQRRTRNLCYAGAILASAAIPVNFTQVRDRLPVNGHPSVYMDGGVRHAAIVSDGLGAWSSLTEKGRAFLLLNTETVLAQASDSDLRPDVLGGLGLTLRSMIDQIQVEAIYDTAAALPGTPTNFVTADHNGCESVRGKERFFSPEYMKCLIKYGEKSWADGANPWIRVHIRPASSAVPATTPPDSRGEP